MACAWHRRVRRRFAPPQPSTRHAKDNQNNTGKLNQQGSRKRFAKQRFFGKRRRNEAKRAGCFGKPPKSEVYGDEKARRRGTVPAEPLGDRLPLLPPRMAFFHWFLPFIVPLVFAFSVRLWQHSFSRTSTVAKSSLKTPI